MQNVEDQLLVTAVGTSFAGDGGTLQGASVHGVLPFVRCLLVHY
jgi:hypothetical protein